jgi:hypothetical protein
LCQRRIINFVLDVCPEIKLRDVRSGDRGGQRSAVLFEPDVCSLGVLLQLGYYKDSYSMYTYEIPVTVSPAKRNGP